MTTVLSMTAEFAKQYGFTHQTSSPRFPQNNGFVEQMIKTVKKLLQQSDNSCLALLTFRSTSLPWCNLSPAELLMGQRLRTRLSQISQHLKPTWSYLTQLWKKDKRFKETQRRNFDRHHRADTTVQKSYQTFLMVKQCGLHLVLLLSKEQLSHPSLSSLARTMSEQMQYYYRGTEST